MSEQAQRENLGSYNRAFVFYARKLADCERTIFIDETAFGT